MTQQNTPKKEKNAKNHDAPLGQVYNALPVFSYTGATGILPNMTPEGMKGATLLDLEQGVNVEKEEQDN